MKAVRIFFSYSKPDTEQAKLIVEALRSSAPESEVFYAPDTLRAGKFWTPALAEEVASADACVVLAGEKAPGPWQLVEYYTAFDRASRDGDFRLVPVVLGTSAEGFPFITLLHWISVAGLAGDRAAALILDALCGRPGERPTPWRYVNPFRDLQALDESAADLFFGRDEEITSAVEALAAATDRAVALIGNSGVGKSSLAYAGVFAALRRQRLPSGRVWPSALDHSREWLYVSFKPGEKPFEALVRAFMLTWQLDPTDAADKAKERDWAERIAKGELSIGHLVEATQDRHARIGAPRPSGAVVYMDQGEELFALPRTEARHFRKPSSQPCLIRASSFSSACARTTMVPCRTTRPCSPLSPASMCRRSMRPTSRQ